MRWLRRTDDARRTKGDPPPTVDQLLVTLKQQGEIIRNLRHQCDGLIAENTRLRTVVAEKTEYAEELALELAQVRSEPKATLRIGRFPVWPEYTYEATYQPPPEHRSEP